MPRQCTNGKIFASAEAKTVEGSSGTALWDNVADLRILPGMGKIVLSAGSPGWGTRGKQASPHRTTLKRVA